MNHGRVSSGTCRGRAPDVAVHAVLSKSCTRTYNHRAKNTATYVHMARVSSAYSRIYTVGQGLCTWRGNGRQQQRPIHRAANRLGQNGETTSCSSGGNRRGRNMSCSSGANRLGWNNRSKQGLVYHRTEETALCSTGHGRNGILFIGRGLAYCKTDFC